MDGKLQQRIQRYGWDRAAPVYEEAWRAQLAPAQEALLAMAAPQPGERVLDVAIQIVEQIQENVDTLGHLLKHE